MLFNVILFIAFVCFCLLQYAALLRLPDTLSFSQKMQYVDHIIDVLDLSACQDTSKSYIIEQHYCMFYLVTAILTGTTEKVRRYLK